MGTVSGRMGMGGCSGGEDTEGCHGKDGLGWGTPGRPPQGAVCGKGPGSVRVSPGKETEHVPEDMGKQPGE